MHHLIFWIVTAIFLPAMLHASPGLCAYGNENDTYDIAKAYAKADLVVVGSLQNGVRKDTVTPVHLTIRQTLKGKAPKTKVELAPCHVAGTAWSGFCGLRDGEYLFLLRAQPDGTFHKVDGNGDDACPNVFLVKDSSVEIGKQKHSLSKLKSYFEKNPAPISY